ncbi:MAG TPA: HPF/RaiA family ribosome-associated protein [Candidatus Angelobacter sp.]|nr:HPF/RaiA family ribosome-associated protein [Candidatus Angelobacter sp.]
MQISMHTSNADLGDAVRSYVERRLRFALARFGSRVGEVTVKLGADGRGESRCRISAEVLPFGRVEVEERGSDLFAAIDRAAGRMGRLFGRELDRVRQARFGRESVRMAA